MFFNDFHVNPVLLKAFIGLVSLLFVNYFIQFIKRVRSLPPGPWGLPFLGYLPFIRQDAHIQITDLAAKYGPVFSFKCGQFDLIVINQWKYIKEALANENILGRPKATLLPGIIDHPSIAEMSGETWRQQRRIAITTLRDVGLGKSAMEDSIKDEIESFTELIRSLKGKPISISDKLSLSVSNNISTLIFGHKYDYDDPIALDMENLLGEGLKSLPFFNVVTFLPTMASFIVKLNLFDMAKTLSIFRRFESHIMDEVDEHRKKDTDEIKDYIDGFLNEMAKRQNETNTTFHMDTIKRNVAVFYGAGSDTISNTLVWIMLYLVKYPEYQNKIREEIKQTIGMNRKPDNVDRQQMPLTMAFIYEALRFSSIVPLNLLRRATQDTQIGGYSIPKDTFVSFNFWSVHRDPNLWENPDQFKPERFLNEDKSKAIKPPHLVAFSGGKRVCPGESFAYLQLFLYLVSILQQFEISAESMKDVTLESVYYFIIRQKSVPSLIFKSID